MGVFFLATVEGPSEGILPEKRTNMFKGVRWQVQRTFLGKGPKIKKRESMVFDHREGGHQKPNPYSELRKYLKP